jgi:hypothetical protein
LLLFLIFVHKDEKEWARAGALQAKVSHQTEHLKKILWQQITQFFRYNVVSTCSRGASDATGQFYHHMIKFDSN